MRATLFQRVQSICRRSPDTVGALHYHDWLIYLLSRAWCYNWYFDPVPGMRYRQYTGNEIGARGCLGSIACRLSMIRNGRYGKQVQAAIDICRLAGGCGAASLRIAQLKTHPPSRRRKLTLTVFMLRHGRRSLAERESSPLRHAWIGSNASLCARHFAGSTVQFLMAN